MSQKGGGIFSVTHSGGIKGRTKGGYLPPGSTPCDSQWGRGEDLPPGGLWQLLEMFRVVSILRRLPLALSE